jgi:hypothetical protein
MAVPVSYYSLNRTTVQQYFARKMFCINIEPISDDYLPSMRMAVLSISGNVYKQQEMEINKLINDV